MFSLSRPIGSRWSLLEVIYEPYEQVLYKGDPDSSPYKFDICGEDRNVGGPCSAKPWASGYYRGAGQLDHQLGAKGRKAAALLLAERLPTLGAQHRRIGAEHRAIGEAEATGAVEHLPAASAIRPGLQPGEQA